LAYTTSCAKLIERTRRFVRDWPDEDVLTASVASTATLISVADGTIYKKNWQVELDQEILTVSADGSGTTFAARRGARGTTAASHVTASVVLRRPHFFAIEIIDALNAAKDACYPYIYKEVLDTSLTTLANTYEYTVPSMSGTYGGQTIPVQYLSKIEVKPVGETNYRPVRNWSVRRGSTPKIQFKELPEAGATIRVHGYGPFPDLVAAADVLDAQWPPQAERLLLTVGASDYLLASGEAGRVRVDTGAMDSREQATRTGSSMAAANGMSARFNRMLQNAAMRPLPPHIKPTF
jgi:hypothetical protein